MELKTDNKFNNTSNNNNNNNNNEDEDALSLRDLQLYDQTATSSTRSSPRASSSPELFEFIPTLPSPTSTAPENIIFCGKVISAQLEDNNNNKYLNSKYHNYNYRSSSSRLHDKPKEHVIPMRSVSNRDLGSPRHGLKFSSFNKKVNDTPLTSVSSKSKRRLFMLGPVKFMPEMEMSSIRERQGRRNPSRMFPVTEGGDIRIKTNTGTDKNDRVRCRTRLNSVFERSLACLKI